MKETMFPMPPCKKRVKCLYLRSTLELEWIRFLGRGECLCNTMQHLGVTAISELLASGMIIVVAPNDIPPVLLLMRNISQVTYSQNKKIVRNQGLK